MGNYKYWFYYYRNENDIETDSVLYAYTDNKKLAKQFEEERNMNRFIKKSRYITKEEVNELARYEKNAILSMYDMKVYDKNKMGFVKFNTVITADEFMTLNLNSGRLNLLTQLSSKCWTNPKLFNKKIYKALEILEYNNIYNNISNKDIDVVVNLEVDNLGLFVYLFGKTLKG